MFYLYIYIDDYSQTNRIVRFNVVFRLQGLQRGPEGKAYISLSRV